MRAYDWIGWLWWWWAKAGRMRVKVQLPPSIDAQMEVVAPNPREDLGVFVQCGDGTRWELQFRWMGVELGVDASMPVALLHTITQIGGVRGRVTVESLPARALPPAVQGE